ncbi:MAG: OmpA family protein [bacterium]|nr:OmpA family protein [bacterium]
MRNGLFQRSRRTIVRRRIACAIGLALSLAAGSAGAEGGADADAINARLYEALAPPSGSGRIETVSGQMYLSKENMDADVIAEALSAMRSLEAGEGTTVAVQRTPRINFEIHFPKNSARLTDESRASLDELAEALRGGDYDSMRFMLGGHTDQDGDAAVNQPLSEARAQMARDYLVEEHGLDQSRLVARGFGASEPLREVEENAQDKLYNRRVDLRPLR